MKKLALALLVASTLSLSAGTEPEKAASCVTCHGVNGEKKALNMSKIINKLSVEEFKASIQNYKLGKGGPLKSVMMGQVTSLSDAEVEELAIHFTKK